MYACMYVDYGDIFVNMNIKWDFAFIYYYDGDLIPVVVSTPL